MKRLMEKLILAGVLIPGPVFAQGMMGMSGMGKQGMQGTGMMGTQGMGMCGGMGMMGSCPMMGEMHGGMHGMGLFNLIWTLDLSDAQLSKVTKLREDYLSKLIEKKFALKRARNKYNEVVEQKGTQSKEAENSLKETAKLQNDIYTLQQNAYRDLKKVIGSSNFERLLRYRGMGGMMHSGSEFEK